MKITTKTIYAIRAVHSLNVLSEGRGDPSPIGLIRLAERLDISNKYLEQIFASLRCKGIVKAVSGKNGGYVLSRKAEEISILDIITTMDGPLISVHCVNNKDCEKCSECSVNWLWNSMRVHWEDYLGGIKVSDLSASKFPVIGCQ